MLIEGQHYLALGPTADTKQVICTEKAMVPHSSTLAWKSPWVEEPGRLRSMGSLRVRHDWATSLSLFTFMHWRRKWQPTPEFLSGESQGWGSLVGCCLWGCTELDTIEVTQQQQQPWTLLVSSCQTRTWLTEWLIIFSRVKAGSYPPLWAPSC